MKIKIAILLIYFTIKIVHIESIYTYATSCAVSRQPNEMATKVVNFRNRSSLPSLQGIAKRIVCTKIEIYTRACVCVYIYARACVYVYTNIYTHRVVGRRRWKGSLREVVIWSNRFRFLCRFLLSPSVISRLSQLSKPFLSPSSHVTFRSKKLYIYLFFCIFVF